MLPDWRGQRREALGKLTSSSVIAWKNRLAQFLKKRSAADTKPSTTVKSLKETRRANEDRMKGLDHGLSAGLGLSLAFFAAGQPCRPLLATEKRYMVPSSSLPFELRAIAPDRTHRACVWDGGAKAGRLEVQWSASRPLLHDCSDMGPSNWPSQYFLYSQAQIRGYFWFDLPHRRHDNVKNAIGKVFQIVRSERTIIHSVWSGPWDGAAHFQGLREAASDYFGSMTADDQMFVLLYPRISEELGCLVSGAEVGSKEHREAVWEVLPTLPCFHHKGFKAMNNRWFQMQKKIRGTAQFDAAVLLVIMYVGLVSGWWERLEDTPLMRSSAPPGAEVEAPALQALCDAPGADQGAPPAHSVGRAPQQRSKRARPPSKPVEFSNHGADTARGHCVNSVHLAGEILANPMHRILALIMERLSLPLEVEHGKEIVMTKTSRGATALHIELGACQRLQGPKGIVDTMLDPDFFVSAGLYTSRGELRGDIGASSETVARMTYNFFQKVLVDEILLLMYFHEMPPNRFFGLLGESEVKHDTLRWMQRVWSFLPVATGKGVHASRFVFSGRSTFWASIVQWWFSQAGKGPIIAQSERVLA